MEVRVFSAAPEIIMDIIDEVKKLNLDPNDFIVTGSGILHVLGIRKTDDIDLAVSKRAVKNLDKNVWKKKDWPKGDPTYSNGIYDIGTDWGDDKNVYTFEELMNDKTAVQGVNFISLSFLKQWKQNKGREKDLADLKLIDAYLDSQLPQPRSRAT